MASASFGPLQPGSWLISILAGFGAVPSNFTVPLTLAAVAGSIGVAAPAGAACCSDVVLVDCSVFAFLLHAVSRLIANNRLTVIIAKHVFFIMSAPFLESLGSTNIDTNGRRGAFTKPFILPRTTAAERRRCTDVARGL